MSPQKKYFCEFGPRGHYDRRFYRHPVEDALRINSLVRLLDVLTRAMAFMDVAPILMHGALIGWYWNKSLLPWDFDIDLCIRYEDLCRIATNPCQHAVWSGFLWEINPNFIDRRTQNRYPKENREPNKIDARLIDPLTGLYIDITALAELKPGIFSTKCPHHYRVDSIFPTNADTVEGIALQVPRDVETVLVQEYGIKSICSNCYRGFHFDDRERKWLRSSGSNLGGDRRISIIQGVR